jgi:hypothetical protein
VNDNVIMSGLAEESPCPDTSIVLVPCASAIELSLASTDIANNAASSIRFMT